MTTELRACDAKLPYIFRYIKEGNPQFCVGQWGLNSHKTAFQAVGRARKPLFVKEFARGGA
ncbi:MAG: hypothetical protein IJ352_02515 [Muribaculaceae bacterium]|nr:hypothetical protein [Muribaculaceae bacterium]MBQ7853885.1 hypothetical protein [Muribaculaceae bacterium]